MREKEIKIDGKKETGDKKIVERMRWSERDEAEIKLELRQRRGRERKGQRGIESVRKRQETDKNRASE